MNRGQLAESVNCCRQALSMYGEFNYPRGRILAADNLGLALRALGDLPGALALNTENLDLAQEIHLQGQQAVALGRLAALYRDAGRSLNAHECAERALVLARTGGDHECLVEALIVLARALADLGRYDEAEAHFAEAMEAVATSGYLVLKVETLIGMADLGACQARAADASASARAALIIATEHGFPLCEGRALTVLAEVTADPLQANEYARRAREVHGRTGYRLDDERIAAVLTGRWGR